MRGATNGNNADLIGKIFQSTHPMRGATPHRAGAYGSILVISIHAPHAGCDIRSEA